MTVLVLAEEIDGSADRIIHRLSAMAVPVLRVDTGWFPHSLSLTGELAADRWTGMLTTPHHRVALTEVRSVWYRSPTAFRFSDQLTPAERGHADREAKLGLGGILATLPALWVNHPSQEADAGYKPRQLAAARACGLATPQTLVTNDPDAVRAFARRCDRVVTKVFGANIIDDHDAGRKIAHTRLLDETDLGDLTGVDATAHLFQEWIGDKKHEARVVVVGSECFAAAIHAGSDAAYIDWRSDYDSLTYSIIDIPSAVARSIRAYMSVFRLNYAAFDFIVTGNTEWIFLEANPGGQFGFIEGNTGLPISHALATLLARGADHHD